MALLGAIIAAFRKGKPIGGWLYFFLWDVFAGVGITVLSVFRDRHYFIPIAWASQTRYLLYMLSFWPRVGALLFLAAAASVLIERRSRHAVELLQTALIAYLTALIATVAIDLAVFPAGRTGAILALFFPVVFLIYTFRSRRFARVFGM